MNETSKEIWQTTVQMWRAASGLLLAWRLLVTLVALIIGGTGLIAHKAGQKQALGEADVRVVQLETEYKERIHVLEDSLSHINQLLEACQSRLETTDNALKASQSETESARKAYATASKENTAPDKRRLCKRLDTIGYRCR